MSPGWATYGQAVGILMQPDRILRMPGDVGNATTFPFPVRYEIVQGAVAAHLKQPDLARAAAPLYVAAARALLECTNLPPFAATIQREAGVPVFDVTTLLGWAHAAATRLPFTGYL